MKTRMRPLVYRPTAPLHTAGKAAAALLYGGAALLIAYYPVAEMKLAGWLQAVFLAGIFLAVGAAAYAGIFHFALPRLANIQVSRRGQAAVFAGTLAAGVLLAAAYPITPVMRGKQEMRITATGTKNTLSTGSEVAVVGLYGWNGARVDLSRFERVQAREAWQVAEGNLVARENFPARLKWQSKWLHPVKLIFLAGPAGGVAEVAWNNQARVVDLYSPLFFLKEVAFWPQFPWFFPAVYFLAFGGLAGLLLLLALVFLLHARWNKVAVSLRRLPAGVEVGLYALPLTAIWLFYWLVLWPGLLSPDSRNQLSQIASGAYTNWHPVFHTWTLWLITRAWNSPAAISLFQIFAMAGVAGAAYLQMARAGVALVWRALGLALFGLSLVNSLLVVTLWKDILFSVAFLAFFVFCVDFIATCGRGGKSPVYWGGFFLAALLTGLYRHNGVTIVPITMALMFVFLGAARLKTAVFTGVFLVVVLLLKGPFIQWMQVNNTTEESFLTMIRVYHIAAHVVAGESFTAENQSYLNQILPYDGDWNHSCYHPDNLLYRKSYHTEIVAAEPQKFQEIFLKTLSSDPRINLDFVVCSSSLIWRISQTPQFNSAAIIVGQDRPDSKLPQGIGKVYALYQRSFDPAVVNWVWRPAVYLYLFLFGVVVKAGRSGGRFLLLAGPALGLCLPLIFLVNNQDFRFMYPVYTLSLLYWPYLLASPRRSAQAQADLHISPGALR